MTRPAYGQAELGYRRAGSSSPYPPKAAPSLCVHIDWAGQGYAKSAEFAAANEVLGIPDIKEKPEKDELNGQEK